MISDWADSPQPESSITDSSEPIWSEQNDATARVLLATALRRLESIESLLLNPTPQHIQEAERIVELAAEDLRDFQTSCQPAGPEGSEFRNCAMAFQATSRRIAALLNGALRIQWHRLRRMGSYHETYTAAGARKVCIPPLPRLDLKM